MALNPSIPRRGWVLTHRHVPALLFAPGLPGGTGSGSYRGGAWCATCGVPLPGAVEAALEDLRRRGMGPGLLARVRREVEGPLRRLHPRG